MEGCGESGGGRESAWEASLRQLSSTISAMQCGDEPPDSAPPPIPPKPPPTLLGPSLPSLPVACPHECPSARSRGKEGVSVCDL